MSGYMKLGNMPTFLVMLLSLPRRAKSFVTMSADAFIACMTTLIAFYLRLGEFVWPVGTETMAVILAVGLSIPIFYIFGVYRAINRYNGSRSQITIIAACLLYGLFYSSAIFILAFPGVPRTLGIIQPVLFLLFIALSRTAARFIFGSLLQGKITARTKSKVLIYGAGSTGRQLAAAFSRNEQVAFEGYLDDDPTLHGRQINQRRIHNPEKLSSLIELYGISDVFLALPSVTRQRRAKILEALRNLPVRVRTLPAISDLVSGRITFADVQDLDPDDLLGRGVVAPNEELKSRNTCGRNVLVTGAGGSIGGELCRQIIAAQPRCLILVEFTEYALYAIHSELEAWLASHPESTTNLVPLLVSVCDPVQMRKIFAEWQPETLYHAAAYKHVPLVESNPAAGIRNNVFGTMNIADLAVEYNVQNFVLISSDKAVRPTNVMGTSKRLAEMVLQGRAAQGCKTCFAIVRFGNVLGSSGSVVPLFRKQIAAGGPVTITDERVTRYFMTIPEAAELVLQAGAMATSGEVFVLDMGKPVKIVDLARKMIGLSGLSVRDDDNPEGDIEIQFIGLRPGEKLYEELLIGSNPTPTFHSRILKANENFMEWTELQANLEQMKQLLDADRDDLRLFLQNLVPEYNPQDSSTSNLYINGRSAPANMHSLIS